MSIAKRKRKDGTIVYDVTLEYGTADGKRHRRKRTFPNLKDAQAAERDAERVRGALKHKGRLKLGEYVAAYYWPIASRRLQATTLDTYRIELDKRILPELGEVYLEDIDRLRIQRMLDGCGTDAVGRKAHSLLRAILNEAVGDGFLMVNPALARYAMPPKGRKRDDGYILTDFIEIQRYLKQTRDAPEPLRRLIVSGLCMGLRPEERYALDYEDISFEDGTLTVRGAYVAAHSRHGGNQMKGTKTEHSQRVIPMSGIFIENIMFATDGTGPWIANRRGERLSPSTGRHMWDIYLREHPDVRKVTLENMRHSFATSCLHAGMNVEDVSRMLGHSDINTTFRRYVKPDIGDLRKAFYKIPWDESLVT